MINEMRNEMSMKRYHIKINVLILTPTKMNESLTEVVKRVACWLLLANFKVIGRRISTNH